MVDLFNIKDTLANKISYYHLMALLASLPFDLFYSHIILISFIIHSLIHLKKDELKPVFNLKVLALTSVFLLTVWSTLYSSNKPEAFNEWGKQLTILIFPLVFCINPLNISKYRLPLLLAFSFVCTATIIYLYADAFITIRHYHLPWSAIVSATFTNHNFSEPINMHATFFSMQIMVALACMIFSIIKEKNKYGKVICAICAVFLTAGIIQLSSKSILIAFLILVNIGVPWLLMEGRTRLRFILASLSFSALVVAGMLTSSAFKERFITELKVDLTKPKPGETYDGRLARWGVTIDLIKHKPLAGYGSGTEIGLLQDGFYQKKLYDSYLNKLNTHSEYLSITLKSGIIGLLIFVATLVWGFKTSIVRRDLLFFNFMVLIALVSVSENLLDVDKGTFFYAFFFSFFMFSAQSEKRMLIPELNRSQKRVPAEETLPVQII